MGFFSDWVDDVSNTISTAFEATSNNFTKAFNGSEVVKGFKGLYDITQSTPVQEAASNLVSGDGAGAIGAIIGAGKNADKNISKAPTGLSSIGISGNSNLSTVGKTFSEEENKRKSLSKKRLGTRGLQIPLTTNVSTTNSDTTAASTGIQI